MRAKNQALDRVRFYHEMNSEMHEKPYKQTRLKRDLEQLRNQSQNQAGSLVLGGAGARTALSGVGAGMAGLSGIGGSPIPMHHKSTFLSVNDAKRADEFESLLERLKEDPLKRGLENLRQIEDSLDVFVKT